MCSLQLNLANSDEEVRAILTEDSGLDALDSIGYRGVPQQETMLSVKEIIW